MLEEDVGFAKRWLNLKIWGYFVQKDVGAGGGGLMSSHAKTKRGKKKSSKYPKSLGFLRGRQKLGTRASNLYIKIAGRLLELIESGLILKIQC